MFQKNRGRKNNISIKSGFAALIFSDYELCYDRRGNDKKCSIDR
ncbi:MAG: hypothetical protein XD91_1107 [Clostridiales bacterium 38_11]|nr:MAG: hypothetical protein XD91_1107 [Clostridiales bacterium 38_11]